MAEQLLDSLVSPTTTTAESVTAGTTTDFDVSSAAALPASGIFRLLLKGAATDGSDDALATVGSISGVNCASVTWVENGQGTFASGTEVELVLTAAGVDAAIDDRVATHEADTSSVHGIPDTSQIALKNAANTFTLAQRFAAGTTSAPGATVGGTNAGMALPTSNNLTLSANATEVLRLLSNQVRLQKYVQVNAPIGFDSEQYDMETYGDYTRTSTTLPLVSVSTFTAGYVFYLDSPSKADFQIVTNQTGSTESFTMSDSASTVMAPGAAKLFVYDYQEGSWRLMT